MQCPEKQSAIERYFQTNLAVIEVQRGENQEDAWLRYLTDNPAASRAHVKIFHYPEPGLLKLEKA